MSKTELLAKAAEYEAKAVAERTQARVLSSVFGGEPDFSIAEGYEQQAKTLRNAAATRASGRAKCFREAA